MTIDKKIAAFRSTAPVYSELDQQDKKLTARPTKTTKRVKEIREAPSFIEAARREQIINCAIDTIASLGYAQTSLAEIAKRAKISKGIITYYFSSKDELIQQVLASIFSKADEFMRSQALATSAAARLRSYIDSNIAFLRNDRKQVLALVDILVNARDKAGKPLLSAAKYEPVLEGLEQILIQGQQAGEFRAFSTRVMAVAIRGAIDGIPGQMTTHPGLDLQAYATELTTLFERATRQPKSRRSK